MKIPPLRWRLVVVVWAGAGCDPICSTESPQGQPAFASRYWLRTAALEQGWQLGAMPPELLHALAAAMKRQAGMLVTAAAAMVDMPLRDAPRRIEPLGGRSLPSFDSLASADGFELQLGYHYFDEDGGDPQVSLKPLLIEWPIDSPSSKLLGKKLECLRRMADPPLAACLSLPWTHPTLLDGDALSWLRDLPITFLTLRWPQLCLASQHPAAGYFAIEPDSVAAAVRRALEASGMASIQVLLDYPWRDGYQAGAAIAAGAAGVYLDGYLQRCWSAIDPGSHPLGMELLLGASGQRAAASAVRAISHWREVMQRLGNEQPIDRFAAQVQAVMEVVEGGR